MTRTIFIALFILPQLVLGQLNEIERNLFDAYEQFREESLSHSRFKHKDLVPLIQQVASRKGFNVQKVGASIEGRSIHLVSVGDGPVNVLLWTQMHGDESTATMAVFDILNFLSAPGTFKTEVRDLLKATRLHFLPMVNPDGAETFKRRNALNIDLNRDALRLQTPEARILKGIRDSLEADFGFNLHDQSRYYNAAGTDKPATISYLAPPYNLEKDINDVRANAMKIIVHMNRAVQEFAPGQVGRYSDDFEPRAFGDNFQKWGTSTMLIESGGQYDDPEKQFIRKLNFISILSALFQIGTGEYASIPLEDYELIPHNDRKLFDLKIENLVYPLGGRQYVLDLGIYRNPIDNSTHDNYHLQSVIGEIGDLSTYFGYESLDATGLELRPGKIYPFESLGALQLAQLDYHHLLDSGYTDIQLDSIPESTVYSWAPVNLTTRTEMLPLHMNIGQNATFLLCDGDRVKYVIVNGFIYDPSTQEISIKNGIVRE